ncbi:formin-like protein 5 [Herpailurus yagouaroundi]|uniref:formin-like protein 5 n=1 Tax=Herpailurus yagouaroundi TaxID=1608482 RepID=UPI001AD735A3|nr:formin-like protein 5 [Puma yagouaroundi]XP_040320348.1 formin-like protein 5 [Puma yagouaroundi]XP_040320349.1 formin-like protein 5 [Puma yagouaroundi]
MRQLPRPIAGWKRQGPLKKLPSHCPSWPPSPLTAPRTSHGGVRPWESLGKGTDWTASLSAQECPEASPPASRHLALARRDPAPAPLFKESASPVPPRPAPALCLPLLLSSPWPPCDLANWTILLPGSPPPPPPPPGGPPPPPPPPSSRAGQVPKSRAYSPPPPTCPITGGSTATCRTFQMLSEPIFSHLESRMSTRGPPCPPSSLALGSGQTSSGSWHLPAWPWDLCSGQASSPLGPGTCLLVASLQACRSFLSSRRCRAHYEQMLCSEDISAGSLLSPEAALTGHPPQLSQPLPHVVPRGPDHSERQLLN